MDSNTMMKKTACSTGCESTNQSCPVLGSSCALPSHYDYNSKYDKSPRLYLSPKETSDRIFANRVGEQLTSPRATAIHQAKHDARLLVGDHSLCVRPGPNSHAMSMVIHRSTPPQAVYLMNRILPPCPGTRLEPPATDRRGAEGASRGAGGSRTVRVGTEPLQPVRGRGAKVILKRTG